MGKFLPTSVVLAAVLAVSQSLVWKDCGSAKGKVNKVSVTNCDNTPICQLKRGSSYTISVDFTANEDFKTAKTVVHGVLMGVPVPFPIDNPDACTNCGLTCPVKSGTAVPYHTDINVKDQYPKVKVVVRWEVKDENGDDLVCIQLPAQIVDGDKESSNQANHIPLQKDDDETLRFKPQA